MQIAFQAEKLQKQLMEKESLVRLFGLKAKKVSLRLDEMGDADNLETLQKLPVMQCQLLTNNPQGPWIISVVANCSIVFAIDHSPVPCNIDGSVNTALITKIRITAFLV